MTQRLCAGVSAIETDNHPEAAEDGSIAFSDLNADEPSYPVSRELLLDMTKNADPRVRRLLDRAEEYDRIAETKSKAKGYGSKIGRNVSLGNRFRSYYHAAVLWSDNRDEFVQEMDRLGRSSDPRDMVRGILAMRTGNTSMDQTTLVELVRKRVPVKDPAVVAEAVNSILVELEQRGEVERFIKAGKQAFFMVEGEIRTTPDKVAGFAIQIQPIRKADNRLWFLARVAAAQQKLAKVPLSRKPHLPVTMADKAHVDLEAGAVRDERLKPLVDFLNAQRERALRYDLGFVDELFDILDDPKAVKQSFFDISGVIDGELLSKLAFIRFQTNTLDNPYVYQDAKVGKNGRLYALNGAVTSQGGDFARSIFRSATKAPPGVSGIKYMLHSFGNLLGFDKVGGANRRRAIFEVDTAKGDKMFGDLLVSQVSNMSSYPQFYYRAKNPATGKMEDFLTELGEAAKGEGFFGALAIGRELRNMYLFAKKRHANRMTPKTTPMQLLQMPEVLLDVAENYETDWIVQLDANNNAMQLAGLLTRDLDLLKATAIAPPDGDYNPDVDAPADVYISPALGVRDRIPAFLKDLSIKELRKVFKKPIFTYVYAGKDRSRENYIEEELRAIAEKRGFTDIREVGGKQVSIGRLFGIEGHSSGLWTLKREAVAARLAGEPFDSIADWRGSDADDDGTGLALLSQVSTPMRIAKGAAGWTIQRDNGQGGFEDGKLIFGSAEEAVLYSIERELVRTMNRALVQEITSRFPVLVEFMQTAAAIESIAKAYYKDRPDLPPLINVPLPDGVVLPWSLEKRFQITTAPATYRAAKTGEMRNVGGAGIAIMTDEYRLAGQGLSAFVVHSHDAYVLRESHRRLEAEEPLKAFVPIHDSFGFHPADAERGQRTVIETMWSLADPRWNIWQEIIKANDWLSEEALETVLERRLASYDTVLEMPDIESIRLALA